MNASERDRFLAVCQESFCWLDNHGGDPERDPGLAGLLKLLSDVISAAESGNDEPLGKKYVAALSPADPDIVRKLTKCLTDVFEGFLGGFDGDVDYIDGFMAAHNFHVFIVEHLVNESGSDVWREMAESTFAERMNDPGTYDTKKGFGDG